MKQKKNATKEPKDCKGAYPLIPISFGRSNINQPKDQRPKLQNQICDTHQKVSPPPKNCDKTIKCVEPQIKAIKDMSKPTVYYQNDHHINDNPFKGDSICSRISNVNDKYYQVSSPKIEDTHRIFAMFKDDILIQNSIAISFLAQHIGISKLGKYAEFFQKRDDIQRQLFDCTQLTQKMQLRGIGDEQKEFVKGLCDENLSSLRNKCACLNAVIFSTTNTYNKGNIDLKKVDIRIQEINDLLSTQSILDKFNFSNLANVYFKQTKMKILDTIRSEFKSTLTKLKKQNYTIINVDGDANRNAGEIMRAKYTQLIQKINDFSDSINSSMIGYSKQYQETLQQLQCLHPSCYSNIHIELMNKLKMFDFDTVKNKSIAHPQEIITLIALKIKEYKDCGNTVAYYLNRLIPMYSSSRMPYINQLNDVPNKVCEYANTIKLASSSNDINTFLCKIDKLFTEKILLYYNGALIGSTMKEIYVRPQVDALLRYVNKSLTDLSKDKANYYKHEDEHLWSLNVCYYYILRRINSFNTKVEINTNLLIFKYEIAQMQKCVKFNCKELASICISSLYNPNTTQALPYQVIQDLIAAFAKDIENLEKVFATAIDKIAKVQNTLLLCIMAAGINISPEIISLAYFSMCKAFDREEKISIQLAFGEYAKLTKARAKKYITLNQCDICTEVSIFKCKMSKLAELAEKCQINNAIIIESDEIKNTIDIDSIASLVQLSNNQKCIKIVKLKICDCSLSYIESMKIGRALAGNTSLKTLSKLLIRY